MWGSSLSRSQTDDGRRNPWHNEPESHQGRVQEESSSTGESSDGEHNVNRDRTGGTWGERDAGHPDTRIALEDFEALRKALSSVSRQSERPDTGISRTLSRKNTHRSTQRRQSFGHSDRAVDDEPGDIGAAAAGEKDEFELDQFMKEGHFEKRKDGRSAKKVGVVWKNLTVKGLGSTATFARTLPDAIMGTFGPDLYKIISGFIPALKLSRHSQTRTLLHDFSGVVKDGEMMLVLGRPGSGCSTFLKAIANNRESYASVEGQVSYGGIPADKQKKQFRGEVNYNPEDDIHFANLNVWQTLYFALMNKTKKNEKHEIPIILGALLKMFGIEHTKYTPVGDEMVRGVSGGERKRVCLSLLADLV
jgi:ATP-binding cassette subfamily G (WHITE) protein 2 (SNQ2)